MRRAMDSHGWNIWTLIFAMTVRLLRPMPPKLDEPISELLHVSLAIGKAMEKFSNLKHRVNRQPREAEILRPFSSGRPPSCGHRGSHARKTGVVSQRPDR